MGVASDRSVDSIWRERDLLIPKLPRHIAGRNGALNTRKQKSLGCAHNNGSLHSWIRSVEVKAVGVRNNRHPVAHGFILFASNDSRTMLMVD